MVTRDELPVVVVGAGPIGLAAAAHVLERGLPVVVLEAAASAGAAVASWGHIRLFSPWRYNIDAACGRLLAQAGWELPDLEVNPTGQQLVEDYLKPLAALPELASRLRYEHRVVGITREGADKSRSLGRERRPYLVRAVRADGVVVDVLARAVLDASGTYGHSNPLGDGGLPARGEAAALAAGQVIGPLPDVTGHDRGRFAGSRTLVVGMGHSAANTLLALVDLAEHDPTTQIVWAIRGGSPRRLYGGGGDDELPARGLLGSRLREAVDSGQVTLTTRVAIDALEPTSSGLRVLGTAREKPWEVEVDTVVNATGFRPDLAMLREVRLNLDPVVESPAGLAELIDPNHHSCGTVPPHGEALLRHPDEGFYLVGMKSYGRAPTFLLATGYEQVRSIAASLAGDEAAAADVQLDLPATGVCSTDTTPEAESACCGSSDPAPQPVTLGFASGLSHGRSSDLPA